MCINLAITQFKSSLLGHSQCGMHGGECKRKTEPLPSGSWWSNERKKTHPLCYSTCCLPANYFYMVIEGWWYNVEVMLVPLHFSDLINVLKWSGASFPTIKKFLVLGRLIYPPARCPHPNSQALWICYMTKVTDGIKAANKLTWRWDDPGLPGWPNIITMVYKSKQNECQSDTTGKRLDQPLGAFRGKKGPQARNGAASRRWKK